MPVSKNKRSSGKTSKYDQDKTTEAIQLLHFRRDLSDLLNRALMVRSQCQLALERFSGILAFGVTANFGEPRSGQASSIERLQYFVNRTNILVDEINMSLTQIDIGNMSADMAQQKTFSLINILTDIVNGMGYTQSEASNTQNTNMAQ